MGRLAEATSYAYAAPETGEVRTYTGRNKDGDEHTIHVERTARPYAFDYADALTDARTRTDLHWFVDSNGEVRVEFDPEFRRKHYRRIEQNLEAERALYKRALAARSATTTRKAMP